MSGWISVRRWPDFQHYRDRNPLWIKNYTRLMHDDNYMSLTPGEVAILHRLWLVYASMHCQLRADTRWLTARLNLRVTSHQVKSLVDAGFIEIVASKELAEGYQPASSLARARGETEREILSTGVSETWNGRAEIDDEVELRAQPVLSALHLTRSQRDEALAAFATSPEGVTRIASDSMSGTVPAALFLTKLRAGEHLAEPHVPRERRTGWTFKRGTHGGTYVEDPDGTDTPPPGYFAGASMPQPSDLSRLDFDDAT